jgi:hypothetical protein
LPSRTDICCAMTSTSWTNTATRFDNTHGSAGEQLAESLLIWV